MFKLTPAMQFVVHSLLSVFIGALVAGLSVIAEDTFTGKADLKTVCGLALTAFGVYFTTNLSKIWSNPQTAQAALDAANEAKQLASQIAAGHQYLQGMIHALSAQPAAQPAQPPVSVHVSTTPASVVQASDSASAMSVPEQPTQNMPVAQPAPAPAIAPALSLPTISQLLPVVPRQ